MTVIPTILEANASEKLELQVARELDMPDPKTKLKDALASYALDTIWSEAKVIDIKSINEEASKQLDEAIDKIRRV